MAAPLSRLAAAVVALLLTVSAGCSGRSDHSSDQSGKDNAARTAPQSPTRPAGGPTTRPAPITVAPTTTAPATSVPTTAVAPGMFFPNHQAAADHLFAAWQNGDRAEALKGATVEAVDALFAVPVTGWERYVYGGYCDTGEFDQGTCNYRSDTQYARVLASHTPPGWQVTSVKISNGL